MEMEFECEGTENNGNSNADNGIGHNVDLYPADFQYATEENHPSFVEAKTVYILMPKNIPISRAKRLQWLLDHLNAVITINNHTIDEFSNDLEVISIIGREEAGKCNRFRITYRTEVKFIAHSYKFVYCLDLSPSQSNIDIQKGKLLFDEILTCFKASVQHLIKQFTIPGSNCTFQPNIYLTVMVNTPFFMSPAQQVLVKGVHLMQDNLKEIIVFIEKQFDLLEGKIADVSAMALDQIDFQTVQNERIVGGLFDLPDSEKYFSKIPMVTPDANFVNMLRYSMLAISLLPENSLSHILVITDGIVAMPDSNIMESLLFQLHYDSIAVSFLKVGSQFQPHASAGYVPYTDLLYFFAHSTLGTCLDCFPDINELPSSSMNMFHELFMLWSFHTTNKFPFPKNSDNKCNLIQSDIYPSFPNNNNINNNNYKPPPLLSKRHTEEYTGSSLLLLLSRRLREGFTIDNISLINGNLEVKLSLQWKAFIFIHYKASSQWPIIKNSTRFEIYIAAPYEFIYDITYIMKKEPKSMNRQAIIERFYIRLTQLSSSELEQQISSFQFNKDWYNLPESVRNGMPVYVLNNAESTSLSLTISKDVSCMKFVNVWQPICQLDTNNWRRWLHVHKVSIILRHDNPLPKYLHLPNSSQRFQVIQCRQAAAALHKMLAEWATFVLIDNHTYLKLIYTEKDKPPESFCIVRINSKFPCAVLNMGFANSTSGNIRHTICDELKNELSTLSYLTSVKSTDNICCVLLQKPLEKILIRYERIPSNFTTVIFPDGTQPPHSNLCLPSPATGSLFITLSRYLYHKRWIWSTSHTSNIKLADTAVARILNTLTKMRIKEGFSFAHSSSGIITMVLELWMDEQSSCLVQYVLFPPHYAYWHNEELYSSSQENVVDQQSDLEGEIQMVTEVWIEPQYGKVQPSKSRIKYMDNKYYYEIADVISKIDSQCISSLLTMEHLSLMCQDKIDQNTNSLNNKCISNNTTRRTFTRRNSFLDSPTSENGSQWHPIITPRIEHIPFKFDPISILPLCEKTELLFSMFIENKDYSSNDNIKTSNKLLIDNILEHLDSLHDKELQLTQEESSRFTKQIILRHKNSHSDSCPITDIHDRRNENLLFLNRSRWRCFLKGISITHVILTFVPASVDDLKVLISDLNPSTGSCDSSERCSSRASNISDVPINCTNAMCLPIYVFDCPLASLVNAYVHNTYEEFANELDDIYEDHRFKPFKEIEEECIRLKEESEKSDETDTSERSCVKQHCKTLVLTHSKCFTISLFVALHCGIFVHSYDVQSAMDQCEENISEIDITDYIMTVCGHVKNHQGDKVETQYIKQTLPCSELKSLHTLIKDKFFEMINVSFDPIPSNREFYYFRSMRSNIEEVNDSDDELSISTSDIEFRYDREAIYPEPLQFRSRIESFISDCNNTDISPLFLHLICTVRYNNGNINTPVRLLPTCLGELIQGNDFQSIDKNNIHVSLDIFCLTLPTHVQNIISNYSSQGLRTTSFCSDGFQPSIGSSLSDNSFNSEVPEPLLNLPDLQKKAISCLIDEIKWILKDEIATSLLDIKPVTSKTLNFIMKHVKDGYVKRTSCLMENIDLNFVFRTSTQSYELFVEEFAKIQLPFYKLCKENDVYYLAKDNLILSPKDYKKEIRYFRNSTDSYPQRKNGDYEVFNNNISNELNKSFLSDAASDKETNCDCDNKLENVSMQSDVSSTSSVVGTDGGYDEDVSEGYEDYDWLINLSNKREDLPNFWLIMKIDSDSVTIYFHCRFLELNSDYVHDYIKVQKRVSEEIRNLCKKVNQLLLLQSLYETKMCDPLLEPDDSCTERQSDANYSPISRNTSYCRLKSMEDTSEEYEIMSYSQSLSDASLDCKPGYFSCPIVWQTEFELNPRLKTGTGLSRGILALKKTLDKFQVSNRSNMFVYRDNNSNVFYLRLQENVKYSGKHLSARPNEFESATVSRSPSIASLPLGHKHNLNQSEQSIVSAISSDIRPRVRSFGEKESKEPTNEDTIILKVHGITEAGTDVQQDLVQVLQNRLDDAVLEFLSVMLARNNMCPLTPSDVQFIQKPFKSPEVIVKLSVQDFALHYIDSFIHYLKQNLLQFLNVPKYTDNRSRFHFKDYSESDDTSDSRIGKDNIFIFNQSQNPQCGNRGISCIALALIYSADNLPEIDIDSHFDNIFKSKQFENTVDSFILDKDSKLPPSYLEFRIWKQGRVKIDHLSQKLRSAVSHATWDIITEYYLLKVPLCETNMSKVATFKNQPIEIENIDQSKEIEFNCMLDLNTQKNIKSSITQNLKKKFKLTIPKKRNKKLSPFENFDQSRKGKIKLQNHLETGDDGILREVYAKYLPIWLDFGYSITTPAVRKHRINLVSKHLPNTIIKELLNLLQDSPKAFRAILTNCLMKDSNEIFVPHNPNHLGQKYVIIARNFENWKSSTNLADTHEIPDNLNPNTLKNVQKFVPAVSNNVFIPRQKILWILIESDGIIIHAYNWAKDNVEKLISNCTNLGAWLCVRSCFLNSVISQKLGFFHNEPLTRKCFMMENNPYESYVGDIEYIKDFPRDHNRKRQNIHNLPLTLEAFRDSFCTSKYKTTDPAVSFTIEMMEMRSMEKKAREEMKILHSMYQSRTSSTTVKQIMLLMQNSRILHYCHTPLLFLPRWRLKSASTRDHSLYPSQAIQLSEKMMCEQKELWHTELCYGFFLDYRNYLQTLGFMALQIDSADHRNSGFFSKWNKDKSSYNSIFYIQKTILGGILLFTVEFNEPFFTTKLHAIECSRLQNISSRGSINRFTVSFLDECDRVKILMHLHSFTYDYHLRCIYNYISNNPGVNKVCDRYNVHQFLDDFLKYYNKAPNFARNLVHTDTLTIKNLVTEGKQLFDYLLTNVDQYDFKVFEMDVGEFGENTNQTEYILVEVTSTPQVSYKDSQDRHHTDDFDITLVVYNLCAPYSPHDNILHLKYYLILTSKREIYPKSEVEHKLGKFRTVSSTGRSYSTLERASAELEHSLGKPDFDNDSDDIYSSDPVSGSETSSEITQELPQPSTSVPHIEICQESVNYLGYYSSHEQLMQQLILDKAHTTQKHIKDMVAKGMVHCRTHLLWNRLISAPEGAALNYDEFLELKGLAKLEHLCDLHPNLGPLLNQPLSWYQGLAKLLLVKYVNRHRTFISPDANIQHYVILDDNYFGAFMLLSIDLHTSRGELYAVYREPHKPEGASSGLAYPIKSLLDGFVNCICYYLWQGMISS